MSERIEIRVSADEKSAYDQAANSSDLERADWIRHTLNAAAKRALRVITRPD